MTPQERDALMPLLDKVQHAQVGAKDPEADQAIRQMVSAQPDAPYILTQSVLMLDYALHQAQAKIDALEQAAQQRPQQSSSGGSFLGSLFGGGSSVPQSSGSPWGQRPVTPPSYAQPINTAMQAGNQPSFLGSAARTAAGIAGGALLFEGMESLLGGHGGFGGGLGMGGFGNAGFGGGGFGGQPVVEETVNNYYDQPAPDANVGVQGGDSSDYTDASSDPGFDDTSSDDSFNI